MSRSTAFIDFDIVGDRQGVQEMLNHMDSALNPIGLSVFLFGSISPWLRRRAAQRFAGQGDDASGKWEPLKDSTIEWRESQGFGSGPINRRTGELENYITQGNGRIISTPVGSSLAYPGTDSVSPALHKKVSTAQKGKKYPHTKPRPVLAVNEADLSFLVTSLAFHVQNYGRVSGK